MSERDEWTDEAGEELAGWVARARRAADAEMSDEDAAHVWALVRHRRRSHRTRGWLLASAAAALAMVAGLAGWRPPASIEIVKEVAFESVHDGQVVRFEMTVYRETRKEKVDADKPSL